jgi:hypothetical protein
MRGSIDRDQVQMAVSVEVRHGNSNRGDSDWEMLRGLEGACPSAE